MFLDKNDFVVKSNPNLIKKQLEVEKANSQQKFKSGVKVMGGTNIYRDEKTVTEIRKMKDGYDQSQI